MRFPVAYSAKAPAALLLLYVFFKLTVFNGAHGYHVKSRGAALEGDLAGTLEKDHAVIVDENHGVSQSAGKQNASLVESKATIPIFTIDLMTDEDKKLARQSDVDWVCRTTIADGGCNDREELVGGELIQKGVCPAGRCCSRIGCKSVGCGDVCTPLSHKSCKVGLLHNSKYSNGNCSCTNSKNFKCSQFAECLEYPSTPDFAGGIKCRCQAGYIGDGIDCRSASAPPSPATRRVRRSGSLGGYADYYGAGSFRPTGYQTTVTQTVTEHGPSGGRHAGGSASGQFGLNIGGGGGFGSGDGASGSSSAEGTAGGGSGGIGSYTSQGGGTSYAGGFNGELSGGLGSGGVTTGGSSARGPLISISLGGGGGASGGFGTGGTTTRGTGDTDFYTPSGSREFTYNGGGGASSYMGGGGGATGGRTVSGPSESGYGLKVNGGGSMSGGFHVGHTGGMGGTLPPSPRPGAHGTFGVNVNVGGGASRSIGIGGSTGGSRTIATTRGGGSPYPPARPAPAPYPPEPTRTVVHPEPRPVLPPEPSRDAIIPPPPIPKPVPPPAPVPGKVFPPRGPPKAVPGGSSVVIPGGSGGGGARARGGGSVGFNAGGSFGINTHGGGGFGINLGGGSIGLSGSGSFGASGGRRRQVYVPPRPIPPAPTVHPGGVRVPEPSVHIPSPPPTPAIVPRPPSPTVPVPVVVPPPGPPAAIVHPPRPAPVPTVHPGVGPLSPTAHGGGSLSYGGSGGGSTSASIQFPGLNKVVSALTRGVSVSGSLNGSFSTSGSFGGGGSGRDSAAFSAKGVGGVNGRRKGKGVNGNGRGGAAANGSGHVSGGAEGGGKVSGSASWSFGKFKLPKVELWGRAHGSTSGHGGAPHPALGAEVTEDIQKSQWSQNTGKNGFYGQGTQGAENAVLPPGQQEDDSGSGNEEAGATGGSETGRSSGAFSYLFDAEPLAPSTAGIDSPACADSPCGAGTCTALSNTEYSCECPLNYTRIEVSPTTKYCLHLNYGQSTTVEKQ